MPAPVTAAASPAVDGPLLPPEAVWQKLIDLAENLHSEQDLSRESIEHLIGLKLKPRPELASTWFVAGDTGAGWNYIFDLAHYSQDDRRMEFGVYLPDLDTATHVSPTCTYSFNRLSEEFKARGFSAKPSGIAPGNIDSWEFSRSDLGLSTSYYLNANIPARSADDMASACVRDISFSFVIPKEKLKHD